MTTQVIKIAEGVPSAEAVQRAADVLMCGGLVAFPTETVYGLAARADDAAAMKRLRKVKQREAENAFTVHIGAREDAQRFAPELSGVARRLIRKGWPGPLTLLLPVAEPKSAPAMADLNGASVSAMYYDNTVGLRFADDPVAIAVVRAVSAPVVAASANRAGRRPPCSARDVLSDLEGQFDLLIDGGETRYAKASTIVRVTATGHEMIREGVYDAGIVDRLSRLRVLLVCTGNTCRSPMAEGIVKQMLAERVGCRPEDLAERGIEVESAGTAGGFGGAAAHAMAIMAKRACNISQHVSRSLTADMIRQADHIFVMTSAHRGAIVSVDPSASDRVALVLDDADVGDPLGGSEEDYARCAANMEEGLRVRLQEVDV